VARRFAKGGYRVALLARTQERLSALERELPEARAYACDVADASQVEETIAKIERDLGTPSVLILRKGFSRYRALPAWRGRCALRFVH